MIVRKKKSSHFNLNYDFKRSIEIDDLSDEIKEMMLPDKRLGKICSKTIEKNKKYSRRLRSSFYISTKLRS